MQFLKTIFWVLVGVLVFYIGFRNWSDVTLNLWGDIQADIKIPVLLLVAFLIGWLPTFLLYRARLWAMKRRLETSERPQVIAPPPPAAQPAAEEQPVI